MSRDDLQRLAIAQALYKELAKVVSTKDPNSLRSEMDRELEEDYRRDGTDRRRIVIDGVEVGTLSAKVSKASKTSRVEVTDWAAFGEYHPDLEVMGQYVMRDESSMMGYLQWLFDETGELPDGCELVEQTTPGGSFIGTTLRGCDAAKVGDALGLQLMGNAVALLEGGE